MYGELESFIDACVYVCMYVRVCCHNVKATGMFCKACIFKYFVGLGTFFYLVGGLSLAKCYAPSMGLFPVRRLG